VLTIHRSKGLEFPVVYCPFLWDPTWIRRGEPVSFHDPALGYRHTIDVGLEGRTYEAHARQHEVEQRGEDLRLAYVALTRAKHQAVIWWAGSKDSRNSPLGRLLFAKDEEGNVKSWSRATPSDAAVDERLRQLAERAPGCIEIERSTLRLPAAWSPPLEPAHVLEVARFERELDLRWRRTSYSDITAEAHDQLVASEPEQPAITDEPEAATPLAPAHATNDAELDRRSLFAELPVGVQFGTFVHAALEATDFTAPDLERELERHAIPRWSFETGEVSAALLGLRAAIETRLGPAVGDLRLRDVPRTDRLDELEFELPLVGGDDPSGRLTLSAIAEVLRSELDPRDPMYEYATRLEDPALRASVRGFLTGSIDLVLRLAGPRFAVVDFKTNWLGAPDDVLTLGHYRAAALAAEMNRAQYGLQALLYTVALHRYLRWRLPGYDPAQHLAAVLYLFVRGMAGEATPVVDGEPCGVYAWRPPGRLVARLSDVLDRGTA
jgi:exodeoxyribonuclease V beta subunit